MTLNLEHFLCHVMKCFTIFLTVVFLTVKKPRAIQKLVQNDAHKPFSWGKNSIPWFWLKSFVLTVWLLISWRSSEVLIRLGTLGNLLRFLISGRCKCVNLSKILTNVYFETHLMKIVIESTFFCNVLWRLTTLSFDIKAPLFLSLWAEINLAILTNFNQHRYKGWYAFYFLATHFIEPYQVFQINRTYNTYQKQMVFGEKQGLTLRSSRSLHSFALTKPIKWSVWCWHHIRFHCIIIFHTSLAVWHFTKFRFEIVPIHTE